MSYIILGFNEARFIYLTTENMTNIMKVYYACGGEVHNEG